MKTIGVMLMASSSHRQKIAAARRPSRTPSNGLERANQNETFQPEPWALGFIFTLFSQAFEDRHFTKHESVPQSVPRIIEARRLIEIAG